MLLLLILAFYLDISSVSILAYDLTSLTYRQAGLVSMYSDDIFLDNNTEWLRKYI